MKKLTSLVTQHLSKMLLKSFSSTKLRLHLWDIQKLVDKNGLKRKVKNSKPDIDKEKREKCEMKRNTEVRKQNDGLNLKENVNDMEMDFALLTKKVSTELLTDINV